MTVSLVSGQFAGDTGYISAYNLAFPGNVTAGNLILCVVERYDHACILDDISDSRGNTWTRDNSVSQSHNNVSIFSCIAKDSGACTVTIDDPSVGIMYASVAVAEFTGVVNNTVDGYNSGTGNSTDVHAGNVGTSADGVVVGVCTNGSTTVTITEDSGWSKIYEYENATKYVAMSFIYKIVSSGSNNPGWTYGAAMTWSAAGVSYLASSAGSIIPKLTEMYRMRRRN